MTFKMCLTLVILLYPGLGTRIFGVLRCSKIQGLEDSQWFQQDLSLECYTSEGRHAQYLQAAVCAICLIVLGFPMLIGVMLWRSRKHLHDTSTSQHQHVKFTLGSVYLMYEKEYWWFEIIVMITKQIMTGALSVLKPGTRKCKRTDVYILPTGNCLQTTERHWTIQLTFILFLLLLSFSPFDYFDYFDYLNCCSNTSWSCSIDNVLVFVDCPRIEAISQLCR
jgi:hypothetical protein